MASNSNRGVVYLKPRSVDVQPAAAVGPAVRATPASAFTSSDRAGGAYSYVDMGGWIGS